MDEQAMITQVNRYDIVCGRGKPLDKHPGNERMRAIIRRHKTRYEQAKKDNKAIVIESVIDIITNGQSSHPSIRFLKRVDNVKGEKPATPLYREATASEIRAKVAHCLRERVKETTSCKSRRHIRKVVSSDSSDSTASSGTHDKNSVSSLGSPDTTSLNADDFDPISLDESMDQDYSSLQVLGIDGDDILGALMDPSPFPPSPIDPAIEAPAPPAALQRVPQDFQHTKFAPSTTPSPPVSPYPAFPMVPYEQGFHGNVDTSGLNVSAGQNLHRQPYRQQVGDDRHFFEKRTLEVPTEFQDERIFINMRQYQGETQDPQAPTYSFRDSSSAFSYSNCRDQTWDGAQPRPQETTQEIVWHRRLGYQEEFLSRNSFTRQPRSSHQGNWKNNDNIFTDEEPLLNQGWCGV